MDKLVLQKIQKFIALNCLRKLTKKDLSLFLKIKLIL